MSSTEKNVLLEYEISEVLNKDGRIEIEKYPYKENIYNGFFCEILYRNFSNSEDKSIRNMLRFFLSPVLKYLINKEYPKLFPTAKDVGNSDLALVILLNIITLSVKKIDGIMSECNSQDFFGIRDKINRNEAEIEKYKGEIFNCFDQIFPLVCLCFLNERFAYLCCSPKPQSYIAAIVEDIVKLSKKDKIEIFYGSNLTRFIRSEHIPLISVLYPKWKHEGDYSDFSLMLSSLLFEIYIARKGNMSPTESVANFLRNFFIQVDILRKENKSLPPNKEAKNNTFSNIYVKLYDFFSLDFSRFEPFFIDRKIKETVEFLKSQLPCFFSTFQELSEEEIKENLADFIYAVFCDSKYPLDYDIIKTNLELNPNKYIGHFFNVSKESIIQLIEENTSASVPVAPEAEQVSVPVSEVLLRRFEQQNCCAPSPMRYVISEKPYKFLPSVFTRSYVSEDMSPYALEILERLSTGIFEIFYSLHDSKLFYYVKETTYKFIFEEMSIENFTLWFNEEFAKTEDEIRGVMEAKDEFFSFFSSKSVVISPQKNWICKVIADIIDLRNKLLNHKLEVLRTAENNFMTTIRKIEQGISAEDVFQEISDKWLEIYEANEARLSEIILEQNIDIKNNLSSLTGLFFHEFSDLGKGIYGSFDRTLKEYPLIGFLREILVFLHYERRKYFANGIISQSQRFLGTFLDTVSGISPRMLENLLIIQFAIEKQKFSSEYYRKEFFTGDKKVLSSRKDVLGDQTLFQLNSYKFPKEMIEAWNFLSVKDNSLACELSASKIFEDTEMDSYLKSSFSHTRIEFANLELIINKFLKNLLFIQDYILRKCLYDTFKKTVEDNEKLDDLSFLNDVQKNLSLLYEKFDRSLDNLCKSNKDKKKILDLISQQQLPGIKKILLFFYKINFISDEYIVHEELRNAYILQNFIKILVDVRLSNAQKRTFLIFEIDNIFNKRYETEFQQLKEENIALFGDLKSLVLTLGLEGTYGDEIIRRSLVLETPLAFTFIDSINSTIYGKKISSHSEEDLTCTKGFLLQRLNSIFCCFAFHEKSFYEFFTNEGDAREEIFTLFRAMLCSDLEKLTLLQEQQERTQDPPEAGEVQDLSEAEEVQDPPEAERTQFSMQTEGSQYFTEIDSIFEQAKHYFDSSGKGY
ncbi:MAG: hypothetical protein LBJ09_01725 [Clostridiales bacterium]|jgi:hypothetical protein|nr:hypothetical protein [Clostridiales bacterium]